MKTKLPDERTLTVIIRDESPHVYMQEPVKRRCVKIALTEEQLAQLSLRHAFTQCGIDYYEEIADSFLEEPENYDHH